MPDILLSSALQLSIHHEGDANHGIERQEKEAINAFTCPKAMLAQQRGIDIDTQLHGQMVAGLEEITEGEVIQRRERG